MKLLGWIILLSNFVFAALMVLYTINIFGIGGLVVRPLDSLPVILTEKQNVFDQFDTPNLYEQNGEIEGSSDSNLFSDSSACRGPFSDLIPSCFAMLDRQPVRILPIISLNPLVIAGYFLLCFLYMIFSRFFSKNRTSSLQNDSWLSLEVQARKAKLRQRIRERDASRG